MDYYIKGEVMEYKLIVHGLMKVDHKYLVIKRSVIKRGKPNVYPKYWDIPGGRVDDGELPREALIRECKEEVGLDVMVGEVIHEDSNLDKEKNIIFTRLVYLCSTNQTEEDIELQLDEHTEYRLINSLKDMSGELLVPFLNELDI